MDAFRALVGLFDSIGSEKTDLDGRRVFQVVSV